MRANFISTFAVDMVTLKFSAVSELKDLIISAWSEILFVKRAVISEPICQNFCGQI